MGAPPDDPLRASPTMFEPQVGSTKTMYPSVLTATQQSLEGLRKTMSTPGFLATQQSLAGLRRTMYPPVLMATQQSLEGTRKTMGTPGFLATQQSLAGLRRTMYPSVLMAAQQSLEGMRKALGQTAQMPEAGHAARANLLAELAVPTRQASVADPPLQVRPQVAPVAVPARDVRLARAMRIRAAVGEVHPGIAEMIDGALSRIEEGGPHAAQQAAGSLIELLDWVFRLAAPDSRVLVWHKTQARRSSELDPRGRPTRQLRLRFVAGSQADAGATDVHVKLAMGLVDLLQATKHHHGPVNVHEVERLLPAIEAVVLFFLRTPSQAQVSGSC